MEFIKKILRELLCNHNYRLTGSMVIRRGKNRVYFLKCESCGKSIREYL